MYIQIKTGTHFVYYICLLYTDKLGTLDAHHEIIYVVVETTTYNGSSRNYYIQCHSHPNRINEQG